MNGILIFAGTTEGRNLSEYLADAGIRHTLCVATQYGEIVLKSHPLVRVRRGRMDCEDIRNFIAEGDFRAVVDATHPYAGIITRNIKAAVEGMDIPYLRLKRDCGLSQCKAGGEAKSITWFATNEACAKALKATEGNILLTTGSRELACYCEDDGVKSRLFARVLPGMESLAACEAQGLRGKRIIAMQGPFSADMNEAIIRQYEIAYLVTKQSGKTGGFFEKLEAAERAGAKIFAIGCQAEEGDSFAEILRKLEKICGQADYGGRPDADCRFEITLAGVGMGSEKSLTGEVLRAIEEADILMGAERILTPYRTGAEKHPFYHAGQILPYLRKLQEEVLSEDKKVTVLFSGDSGFYSGCQALYRALSEEIRWGRLRAGLRVLPGVSSVAALAARIGESYQDAAVYSMHGKKVDCLAGKIKRNHKTFLLLSGVEDINRLGKLLMEAGLEECEVTAGCQLSYEEEQVRRLSPKECCGLREEGLYVCMVKNPHARKRRLTHGIPDGEFIRDRVPMTKEEVREISICKLRLCDGAVVYDIGSGTGSVAVETAGLSDEVQVYAIEQKKEAVSLIRKNREKYGQENITVVDKRAPEGLLNLPAATHAFIGGSGGKLGEILDELYRINSGMRIVINAVSMETICEIREYLAVHGIENGEIVQVQINRVGKLGQYHLMQAENPVWICAFDFRGSWPGDGLQTSGGSRNNETGRLPGGYPAKADEEVIWK